MARSLAFCLDVWLVPSAETGPIAAFLAILCAKVSQGHTFVCPNVSTSKNIGHPSLPTSSKKPYPMAQR